MITFNKFWIKVPSSVLCELNLKNGDEIETFESFMQLIDYVLTHIKSVEMGEI